MVQTSSSESNEDGFQSPGAGAAVVDSLRLRDATTDASIVADVDFEDGSTGGWTLAAQNGYFGPNVVPVGYVRDVPSATSQAGVVSGFDFNDPTCVWQFTATNGYAAPGQFTYLTSPWFPAFQSDSGFVVVMTSKLPLSTSVERRFIQPFMRGKNVGDAGPRLIARPSFILFGGGATTDASAPLTSVTSRYPQDFTIFTPLVSQFTDSVQFVLRSLDRPEPSLRLLGRTPTRLPFIDDIEIYLINVDRDHDGVPDAVDGCPTVSAAGQDANGDGCTDQGATLRHVESWSESRPLHVAISANGDPRIADGSDLTEVQAGFQAWSGVPGSSLSIQFDAPTVAHDSSPLDGVNLITFEDDHFSFPPDVVAVTPTLSFTTRGSYLDEPALPGEIVDADMIFNPAFTFSTPTHNGGPGSFDHSYFKPDFARLADVAQVVYLDLPGHGRSDRGHPAQWSFELCADAVRDFCDAVGIEKPVVLGHSLGGVIALVYGIRHPGHAGAYGDHRSGGPAEARECPCGL